jgi:hypothetical protein
MAQVLPRLIGAKDFFAAPHANRAYLAREHVDYIVVLEPQIRIGSWRPFGTDGDAIADLPDVELVSSSGSVTVYAFGSARKEASAPTPSRCPL